MINHIFVDLFDKRHPIVIVNTYTALEVHHCQVVSVRCNCCVMDDVSEILTSVY